VTGIEHMRLRTAMAESSPRRFCARPCSHAGPRAAKKRFSRSHWHKVSAVSKQVSNAQDVFASRAATSVARREKIGHSHHGLRIRHVGPAIQGAFPFFCRLLRMGSARGFQLRQCDEMSQKLMMSRDAMGLIIRSRDPREASQSPMTARSGLSRSGRFRRLQHSRNSSFARQ